MQNGKDQSEGSIYEFDIPKSMNCTCSCKRISMHNSVVGVTRLSTAYCVTVFEKHELLHSRRCFQEPYTGTVAEICVN